MAPQFDVFSPSPIDAQVDDIDPAHPLPGAAKPVSPNPPSGLTIERMSPTAAAGVSLAQFVLWMVVTSIVSLTVYLGAMEFLIGRDIQNVYHKVHASGAGGAELAIIRQLNRLAADLGSARLDGGFQFSEDTIKVGRDMATMVEQMPSLDLADRAKMSLCIPPPSGASRVSVIDGCLTLLAGLRSAIIEQAVSFSRAQSAADAVGKMNEHRQALRSFWIQAAQLILLNLLLPLLTALFGYVFGTQQAQRG